MTASEEPAILGKDQSYGPNWALALVLVCMTVTALVNLKHFDAPGVSESLSIAIKAIIVGVPALLLIWILSVRLHINAEGVVYKSLRSTRTLTWDSIKTVRSGTTRYKVNGIPYAYRTVVQVSGGDLKRTVTGRTVKQIGKLSFSKSKISSSGSALYITFGWRFWGSQAAGKTIETRVFSVLLNKALHSFDAQEDVDFGALVINQMGIGTSSSEDALDDLFAEMFHASTPKSLAAENCVPWSSIISYSVQEEYFVVITDKGVALKIPLADITNPLVLAAVFNEKSTLIVDQPSLRSRKGD